MYFIIYDTEFTAWPGSMARRWSEEWEHRELLQLAALKVFVSEDGCIAVESFSRLIKPIVNPTLSQYIIELTGLDQDEINKHGVSFPSAISAFTEFCRLDEVKMASWGNDHVVLLENANLHDIQLDPLLMRHIDLSVSMKKVKEFDFSVCSGKLHERVGIKVNGHVHNALHDVKSILVTLDYLLKQQLVDLESIVADEKW